MSYNMGGFNPPPPTTYHPCLAFFLMYKVTDSQMKENISLDLNENQLKTYKVNTKTRAVTHRNTQKVFITFLFNL